MNRFENKVAVVSGGARGIGQGCARRLAAEGAKVVIGDLSEDRTALEEIEASGGEAMQIVLDVRKREDWQRLVSEATDRYGRVDLLSNNAGITNSISPDNVVELTDEGWDSVVDTHLRGTWLGMQACIPEMKKAGGGAIVNMSSMAAVDGIPNLASYSAAKGGILGLTRQVAQDFGAEGIRVNAICPGTIRTQLLEDTFTPEIIEILEDKHIIKRLGTIDEVGAMVAYLLSSDADFVTGQTLNCDGGWSIN